MPCEEQTKNTPRSTSGILGDKCKNDYSTIYGGGKKVLLFVREEVAIAADVNVNPKGTHPWQSKKGPP